MHLTIIFFFIVNTSCVISLKKCCDQNSYLTKLDSQYFCDKDEDKRLQIFTNHTNFLNETGADDDCFDGHDSIVRYKIKNHTVIEEEPIDVNFYYKCCPLNHFYNSVNHSCVYKRNLTVDFISQNFIKVGLPDCRVIVDYNLESGRHYYRKEMGMLYIDGESIKFNEKKYCIDVDDNNSLIARGCHDDLKICNDTRCIHKCCPDGQSFVNGQKCRNTYVHGIDLAFSHRINNSQDPFALIHGYTCRIYLLRPKIFFYLDTDGVFYAFYNKTNSYRPFKVDEKSYCIEHAYKAKGKNVTLNGFQFFMCFLDEPIPVKFLAARWAKILSCIFIICTAAVYLLLPEMLNLFGKILLNYCTAMLTVFTLLTYTQFQANRSDRACQTTSFVSLYMSLSSFTWLNVMCFDIWWTFGTPKSIVTAQQKKSELKRIIYYALYGWGLSLILTMITFMAYAVFNTPYKFRPFLGTYKCYFETRSGNYAMLLYYAMPLIFMEIANVVLFVLTIKYCLKVKGEINRMNDNRTPSMKERKKGFNADKEQLTLVLKLSVTMGLSFAFEVVSSLYPLNKNPATEYIEVVWDTINCLQGVFIFIIFICKRRVFKLCRNRIFGDKSRKISVSSTPTATTQVTAPLNSQSKIRNV